MFHYLLQYTELLKIKRLEQGYQDSLKESIEIENKESDDVDDRVPLTKDLTAIVEKIAQNKGVNENNREGPVIALQKIANSSVAVFQSVHTCEDKQKENMKVQVSVHFILPEYTYEITVGIGKS